MAKVKKQYVDDGNGNKELFYPATISDAVKFPDNSETLTERLSHFSKEENNEFLAVETDADGKILAATYPDGSHYAHNLKSETIDELPSEIAAKANKADVDTSLNGKVDKVDGKSLIDEDVAAAKSTIEDPEGRMEITTDADGKILGYRDEEGIRYEENMSVKNLVVEGKITETEKKLTDANCMDLPIPSLAYCNFINIAAFPIGKTQDAKAILEYKDNYGNSFRKRVILNAQGNSTMSRPKKNLSVDLTNDEWIGDDTFSIRFGDWVAQDGFHLKAYYDDVLRGVAAVAYEINEQIMMTRGFLNDRPYKRLYANNFTETTSEPSETYRYNEALSTNAKCFPMGFPVIVTLNGEFYGIYSWQIKKHRDNYQMDKSNVNHIHLDGTLGGNTIFGGNVDWTMFEIRNPKKLITTDGSKYDGDSPKELIGKTSSSYDASNKDMKNTALVKEKIESLSLYMTEINTYINEDTHTEEEIKAYISERFEMSFFVDYVIMMSILQNGDSMEKNWQWTTYDGKVWQPNAYDLDSSFGITFTGQIHSPASALIMPGGDINPATLVSRYYMTELKERYNELKAANIITSDNIVSLILDWVNRVGIDNYKKEFKKWNESPCFRESCISEDWEYEESVYITSFPVDTWNAYGTHVTYSAGALCTYKNRLYRSSVDNNKDNIPSSDSTYWQDLTYQSHQAKAGDKAIYGKWNFYKFKAKVDTEQPPLVGFYDTYPSELGRFDSLPRIVKWVEQQIKLLDVYINNLK